MGRPRKHETEAAAKLAHAANTRRADALARLLENGYIRLHTADAADDATWIVGQPEAISRIAVAKERERDGKVFWVVVLKETEEAEPAA